jgi:hypothetical protein
LPPSAPPAAEHADAFLVDTASAFVPYANDVPLMAGIGVRLAGVHELTVRVGYMPTGDDVRLGFGVLGYRAALRPGKLVRPVLGGFIAGLPESCVHDAAGDPSCTRDRLFIFSASGGVRFEPAPWLGITTSLALGMDSYPNPFGMVELGLTFALPLS